MARDATEARDVMRQGKEAPAQNPSFDWLCAAATQFLQCAADTTATNASTLLVEPPDTPNLVALAAHHRLLPLIHHTLELTQTATASRTLRTAAWAAYRKNLERNLAFEQELARVVVQLQAKGIHAVAHKGPALARWLYGDPGLRVYTDLDVLVVERHLFDAATALTELGYVLPSQIPMRYRSQFLHAAQQYDLVLTHPDTGIMIELHWRTDARFHVERLDAIASSTPTEIAGVAIRQLPPRELLFALLIHGTKHKWEHLLWLLDVALLAQKIDLADWSWLASAARAQRCEVRFLLGLFLANALFGSAIPELDCSPRARQRAARLAQEIASALRRQGVVAPLGWFRDFRGDLRFNDRWQQSVAQTLQLVFAPNLRDWHHVGDHPGALVLAFPKRLAGAIWRRLRAR